MDSIEQALREATRVAVPELDMARVQRRRAHVGRQRRIATVVAVASVLGLLALGLAWRTGGDASLGVIAGPSDDAQLTQWHKTVLPFWANDVLATDRGWVAVGQDAGAEAIWWSRDGASWQQTMRGAAVAPSSPKHPLVQHVRYADGRFVAFGQRISSVSGDVVAAVWTSVDGRSWQRSDEGPFAPAGNPIPADTSTARSTITDLVVTNDGWFAVGQVFTGSFSGGLLAPGAFNYAAWRSTDGTQWERATLPGDLANGTTPAVTASGGTLVLGGKTASGSPAIWVEPGAWSRTDLSDQPGVVTALASEAGRLVAVGSLSGSRSPRADAMWTSRDGSPWQLVASPWSGVAGLLGTVVGGPSGFVATGSTETWPPTLSVSISTDGLAWRSVALVDGVFAARSSALSINAGSVWTITAQESYAGDGSAGSPDRPRTVVWTPAALADRVVVDGDAGWELSVPPSWHVASTSLTPYLSDPVERVSVATIDLEGLGEGDCAQVPTAALNKLSSHDAFVTVQERQPAGAASGWTQRPSLFEPTAFPSGWRDAADASECMADPTMVDLWWIPFADGPRHFYALVAIGQDAPESTRAATWQTLSSFRTN
jgi:hypothetical protein